MGVVSGEHVNCTASLTFVCEMTRERRITKSGRWAVSRNMGTHTRGEGRNGLLGNRSTCTRNLSAMATISAAGRGHKIGDGMKENGWSGGWSKVLIRARVLLGGVDQTKKTSSWEKREKDGLGKRVIWAVHQGYSKLPF